MRFQLVIDGYNEVVRDTERNVNVFFLATDGFGVHSDTRDLAKVVVEYLNYSQPDKITASNAKTGTIG